MDSTYNRQQSFQHRHPSGESQFDHGRGSRDWISSGRVDGWLADRAARRQAIRVHIWASSPSGPETDSSEEERERKRHKKERQRLKKEKAERRARYADDEVRSGRPSGIHASSDSRRSRSRTDASVDRRDGREYEHGSSSKARYRTEHSRHHRSRSRSRSPQRRSRRDATRHDDSQDYEETEWAEKGTSTTQKDVAPTTSLALRSPDLNRAQRVDDQAGSSDDEYGPKPLTIKEDEVNERAYGANLLAGEGSAMAAYVTSGQRIPRRGEIGLEPEQIEAFEKAGFVMSGSRHRAMNAVRLRKENQVLSVEEERQLLKMRKKQTLEKEIAVVDSFRELVEERLRDQRGVYQEQ